MSDLKRGNQMKGKGSYSRRFLWKTFMNHKEHNESQGNQGYYFLILK